MLAALSLVLAGCNLPAFEEGLIPSPGPAETATSELPTNTPEPTQPPETPTGAPTETPDATPAPDATETPAEAASCVAPGGATLPGGSPAFDTYGDTFEEYLSAGGAIGQLRETLQQWDAIVETQAGTFGMVDAEHDLTGDGALDVVISVVNPEAEPLTFIPPGRLFVYYCADGVYELAYTDAGTDDAQAGLPEVVALEDVTGDGIADVLHASSTCGAHTCFVNVQGARWSDDASEFVQLFEEPVSEPYAEVEVLDETGDDVGDVVVDVGMIGSVGAGPQRTWRDVYTWQGEGFERVEHEATSPAHPIHLINEADDLLLSGEYADAIPLLQRSYEDPLLDREWALYEGWEADLEAYARYRVMLSHVALGADEQAQAVYERLVEDFPTADVPGGVFAGWAETFWSAYQPGGSAGAGCEAVLALVDTPDFDVIPLNQYGYANRQYDPQEMCPLDE